LSNIVEIVITGKNLTGPEFAQVRRDAKAAGTATGKEFSDGLGRSVHDEVPGQLALPFEDARKEAPRLGRETGQEFTSGLGTALGDGVPPKIRKPLVDGGTEGGKAGGQAAGKSFGQGMSPLILSAIAGVALVGPAAILAGLSAGLVGAAVLVQHSNADIQAEYKTLATHVGAELKGATAPLVPAIEGAMVQADTAITRMGPNLKKIFTDVEPDVQVLTSGITSLVGNTLPGLEKGLDQSRGITASFAQGLGTLGTGLGNFFSGLSTDAQSTGRGLESFFTLLSTTLGTLGHVVGVASADASTALTAVTPALDGVLNVTSKLATPQTIGAVGGLFAAMKIDPALSSGIGKVSSGLLSLSEKTAGASGLTDKFSGATLGSARALNAVAGVLGGPWGLAIGAGIGLLTGYITQSHQAAATASDFTAAIAQDSGVVGSNTTAKVEQIAQTAKLGKFADTLGISMTTLTEAMAGNKDAAANVAGAYDVQARAAGKAVDKMSLWQQVLAPELSGAEKRQDALQKEKKAYDQISTSVQGALKQTTQQMQVYDAVTRSGDGYTAAVSSATTTLQANAQQTGINTVAALNLGQAQTALSQGLSQVVDQYALAQSGATAYGQVLQALNDDTTALLGAQATFTTQLDTLTKVTKGQTDSLDVNNSVGAKNITTLTNIAKAAEKAAVATFQNEVQTKGADKAYNDANSSLATMRQRFIAAADKAGYNKVQVAALARELFALPKNIDVGINATRAYAGARGLVRYIDSLTGTVQMQVTGPSSGITGSGHKFMASGGIVGGGVGTAATGGARASFTWVGEHGPELLDLAPGTRVHSNPDSMAMAAAAAGGSGPRELQLTFAGNTDSVFATAFMKLVRTGVIQLAVK
jgi:hypothetical protein